MDAIEKGVNDIRSKNKECKNMRYMRIDGETPARQREENVTAFQNDENCRVSMCQLHVLFPSPEDTLHPAWQSTHYWQQNPDCDVTSGPCAPASPHRTAPLKQGKKVSKLMQGHPSSSGPGR